MSPYPRSCLPRVSRTPGVLLPERGCRPASRRLYGRSARMGATDVSTVRDVPICDLRHGADAGGSSFLSVFFQLGRWAPQLPSVHRAGRAAGALRTKRTNVVSQEFNISFRAQAVTKPATVSNRLTKL